VSLPVSLYIVTAVTAGQDSDCQQLTTDFQGFDNLIALHFKRWPWTMNIFTEVYRRMCSNSTRSVYGVTMHSHSCVWLLSLWEWHPLLFSRMEQSTRKTWNSYVSPHCSVWSPRAAYHWTELNGPTCWYSYCWYCTHTAGTWGLVLWPELALHELPPSCLHIQFFLDTRIRATRVPTCRTQHRRALSSCMQLMEIKRFSEDVRNCSVFSKCTMCEIAIANTPLLVDKNMTESTVDSEAMTS